MNPDKNIELSHTGAWTIWEGGYVAGRDAMEQHLPQKHDPAFKRTLILRKGLKLLGLAHADCSKDYNLEGLYIDPEEGEMFFSTLLSFARAVRDDMKSRGKTVLVLKAPMNDDRLNKFYTFLGARRLNDRDAYHYYTMNLSE